MDFKTKMMAAWNGQPPRVKFITQPMPGTPYLHLSGSGCASTTSVDKFIQELEQDQKKQKGHYYAYVKGGCREEADTYVLEGWEVLTGENSIYEATVILYYSALNPYLTIKKWMGEDMAEKHLIKMTAAIN